MTKKEFEKVFTDADVVVDGWQGDHAFQGLLLIAKYFPISKTTILVAAEHDLVCSVTVQELCRAGITPEDAELLRRLHWSIDNDHLVCHV